LTEGATENDASELSLSIESANEHSDENANDKNLLEFDGMIQEEEETKQYFKCEKEL
jgi:hypothetical protein